jgi:hypothetical protein
MAGSSRRLALTSVLLPFLFLTMTGSGARQLHRRQYARGGQRDRTVRHLRRGRGSQHFRKGEWLHGDRDDVILFAVTGVITIDEPLEITSGFLQGPVRWEDRDKFTTRPHKRRPEPPYGGAGLAYSINLLEPVSGWGQRANSIIGEEDRCPNSDNRRRSQQL